MEHAAKYFFQKLFFSGRAEPSVYRAKTAINLNCESTDGQLCTFRTSFNGNGGHFKMKRPVFYMVFFAVASLASAQEKKLTVSGYSEVRLSAAFGQTVDDVAAKRFEASGGDEELLGTGNQIYFPGFNLNLLSEISPKLYFQGELNFEYFDEILDISLFRSYLDYRFHDKFNLQAGKFLSPIGYINRNQRTYGYLNYSIKPRDMVEEEFGFLPSVMVGLQVYGSFVTKLAALNYRFAYGNMRTLVPYGRAVSVAELGGKSEFAPGLAAALEANIPAGNGEILIGMSVYSNPNITSIYLPEGAETKEDDPSNVTLSLSETGFAPYIRFDFPKFQFFGELNTSGFEDKGKLTSPTHNRYAAASIEMVYKMEALGKGFYPYLRYDFRNIDDTHPYFGLSLKKDIIHKDYSFNSSEIVLGSALDVMPGNRIKFEIGKFLTGLNPSYRIALSTSFAF
jgi:hypothetical protein